MSQRNSVKSYAATLLLTIGLGFVGAHRFYAGKVFTGVLFLLTGGVVGIGWIIDIFTVSFGNFTDKTGRFIRPTKKTPTPEGQPMASTPQPPANTPHEVPPADGSAAVNPPPGGNGVGGGVEPTPKKKVPTWVWVVGGIAVFGLILSSVRGDNGDTAPDSTAGSAQEQEAEQSTVEPGADAATDAADEATSDPADSLAGFGDGTYIVGESIEPGVYRSADSSLCYWERVSGFGGTLGEIIANGNDATIIEISADDAGFKTQRCGQWLPLEDTYPSTPATEFADGTYEVGTHIEPGRYSNSGGETCYYERVSGFSRTLGDIISNDFGSTTAVVEIREGDRGFTTRGCGTWTKSG